MTGILMDLRGFADMWWGWIAAGVWQSALVGLVLLAVVLVGRRWPSPIRYAILIVAIAKFAVPPMWSAPTGVFSHVGPEYASASALLDTPLIFDDQRNPAPPSVPATVVATELDRPADRLNDQPLAPTNDEPTTDALAAPPSRNSVFPGDDPTTAGARVEIADRVARQSHPPAEAARVSHSSMATPWVVLAANWKICLLAIHLTGAFVVFGLLIRQLMALRQVVQQSQQVEDQRLTSAATDATRQLRLRRAVRLLASNQVDSPMAFGLWQPIVILPATATELSDRDLQSVLVHECAHLRRGDAWINGLQLMLMIVWWFHPVYWLVSRMLRSVREDCCDDMLLVSGVASQSDYCDTLLRVAAHGTARADMVYSMASRMHPLGHRLQRIMDQRVHRSMRLSIYSAAAVVLIAIVLLPGLRTEAESDGKANPDGNSDAQRASATVPDTERTADKSAEQNQATADTKPKPDEPAATSPAKLLPWGLTPGRAPDSPLPSKVENTSAQSRPIVREGASGLVTTSTDPVIDAMAASPLNDPNSNEEAPWQDDRRSGDAETRQIPEIVARGIGKRFPPSANLLQLVDPPMPLNDAPGPMMTVAFSPDGTLVATGCGHGTGPGEVVVWDRETGREQFVHRHSLGVRSVAFSPDGRRLATGHYDSTSQILDVATGRVLHVFRKHTAAINGIAFTPDGKRFATGSHDRTIAVWNLQTKTLERTLTGHEHDIITIDISRDGTRLVSAGRDRTLRVWDLETGDTRHVLEGHSELVNTVAFSPEGKRIVSGSFDRTIRVWDADSGECLQTLNSDEGRVVSMAFSPDGMVLVSGHWSGTIVRWDARTGERTGSIHRAHNMPVFGLMFASDGQTLISSGFDGVAKIWDNEQELLQTFKRHAPPNAETLPILAAAWSPDEQFIVTAHATGIVRLTRVATGEVLHELNKEDDPAHALAVSPDGATLALGCDSGALLLWNPKTNAAELQTFDRHSAAVRGVAFSPNGKLLASCSDDATICVFSRESGECTARLETEEDAPTVIAFAPDNQLLVSGHTSGHLRFWDLTNQSERNQSVVYAGPIVAIAFSPDGSTVAAADGQSVRVWDVTPPVPGNEVVPRLSLSAFESPVMSLGFAPRSRGLLTGGTGGELLIWDPSSGDRVARHRRHTGPVTSIAVAPQSERVLTTGPATPGLLWAPLPDEDRIRPLAAVSDHKKGARFVRISPDRRTLVVGGFDNRVSIWDLTTGELRRRLGDPDVIASCQLSLDGKLLAVSYRNGQLEVQDVQTAEVVHRLPELEHSADVLAFSPDGSHLAAMCRDHGLWVYDLAAPGAKTTILLAPPHLPLTHVAFAPDSQSFLTCIGDWQRRQTPGETILWDRDTGTQIGSFGGHASEVRYAAFHPDGTLLVTGGADRTAHVWDVTTERKQSQLQHHSAVFAAVFVPHSDLLFTSTYDGGLSLWNWRMEARLMRIPAHSDFIGRLDLTSDLSVLATASRDGYVKLWALSGESNELRIVNANPP